MKLLHQPEEIIAQRYCILNQLGQGGVGITYQALDLNTNEKVALKVLPLRRMTDWKKIELFEREAQILSQLNHPAIPHYLDYFQIDTESDKSFYIVQQLAPGKSLDELVENGWLPDEKEVHKIAIKVLEILTYLHSLTPPVIHRDIKPQNIILNSDKQVFLVDFGAVQDTYHNTVTGGSTIVGTFGYMAPEQFRGQAVLSTDLYGLGTTILFLLTGKSPADLPSRKLKINFRSEVCVSRQFANWLEKMLSPVIEERFPSAAAALAVLQGQETLSNYASKKRDRMEKRRNIFQQITENFIVKIAPKSLLSERDRRMTIFFLIWNSLLFGLLYLSFDTLRILPLSEIVILCYILIGILLRSNPKLIFTVGAVLWNGLTLFIFGVCSIVLAVYGMKVDLKSAGTWDIPHHIYDRILLITCVIGLIDLFVVYWLQRRFLIRLKRKYW